MANGKLKQDNEDRLEISDDVPVEYLRDIIRELKKLNMLMSLTYDLRVKDEDVEV